MSLTVWLAFFAASWAISISPGTGAIAAMHSGLSHGFARGYVTTFGLALGILTQVLVVGVGLGALIAASALAYLVVKWAGVAYLVWLGIRQWRAPVRVLQVAAVSAAAPTRCRLMLRGWLVNVSNPKGTAFILAIVPQFLDAAKPLWPQYLAIGATLAFTDLTVMAAYTALASRVLRWLRTPAQLRALNRVFGGLFVAMGALLATVKRA